MALTLNEMSLEDYLNQKHPEVGFTRFVNMVDIWKWPKSQIANELGISRPWLNELIKKLREEQQNGSSS